METDANKWMFDFKEKKFQGYVVKNHPSKKVKKKKNQTPKTQIERIITQKLRPRKTLPKWQNNDF